MSTRSKAFAGAFALVLLTAVVIVMIGGGPREYFSSLFPPEPQLPPGARSAAAAGAQTRPTSRSADRSDPTLVRELPRQALLITAAHEFGLPPSDRAVDFAGPESGTRLSCKLTYDRRRPTTRAAVAVHDAAGKQLRAIDLPIPVLGKDHPDYAKLAPAIESWCDAHFAPLLTGEGNLRKPVTAEPSAPVPAEVTTNLMLIDPRHAFLAARTLHEAIAASGESPDRLAAVVRAYANLGESTRHLYSAHGSAFFARALVYAERLARKHPDLALAVAARGYAYALLGQYLDARRDFARARELAGATGGLPEWAVLAEELSHFRTRALFDRVSGGSPAAPLASYFALLTIEHSGMQAVVINTSRLALEGNPSALRVVNIMTDNSGVSLQHETTEQLSRMVFATLAALAEEPTAPEKVKAAAREAKRRNFAAPAVLDVLAALNAEPATPGQLLPWSTFASIAHDALFLAGFRRLYFTDQMLGTDPSNRLKAWWPMLKDHRFGPYLSGYDRTGEIGDKQAVAALRRVSLDDFYTRHPWMIDHVKKLDAARPAAQRRWIESYEYGPDETGYDLACQLWTYHGKEGDAIPILAMTKGELAKQLAEMYPDHPLVLAELIVNRWPETRARAAEIERDMGGHPQVGYALARAYRSEKRFADAARLLEQVIEISPDRAAYEELADMHMQQGDADKWLEVSEKYLSNTEDFGLDHSDKQAEIAYAMLRMDKPDRALKYAKAAADSYSASGLRTYATVLTELGRYDEAERVEKANQERYPESAAWYRWCQTTGRGDLKGARELTEPVARALEQDAAPRHDFPSDVVVYLYLEGQLDRARALWERELSRQVDPYESLQLALLDIEQNKVTDDTDVHLGAAEAPPSLSQLPPEFAKLVGNVTPPQDELRYKIYRIAAREVRRCLEDPAALPRRDGEEVKFILDHTTSPYRANAAYFFGRLCELRGNPQDAKWWYRTALETQEWTAICRPQAAVGLRRLGEKAYK